MTNEKRIDCPSCGGFVWDSGIDHKEGCAVVTGKTYKVIDRTYKVIVSGDLAYELLKGLQDTEWLDDMRLSPVVLYVRTSGSAERRNDYIDAGKAPRREDEHTYLMEVMELDEGTFRNMRAIEVTRKAWSI